MSEIDYICLLSNEDFGLALGEYRMYFLPLFSTLTKRMKRFPDTIIHNDERGEWISPPPAEEGIEEESQQHSSSEIGINQRHAPFG